ncbi:MULTISPECIES: Sec-independent protein translocase subunit TatA/TatB [Arcobacter]|jgi:sec-independent protein translocase protein TatA|uniref:Sec-independent protein translocase protein TatA n=1 Tax=Arcobacter ellisii TaxID=913109 RepID=A0A347UBI2_9BACT|nr:MULTISPECIES: twin-arginine translocase TatA/TatE family subunit [Arcobacter]AXX96210.1 twin arginine translocation system, TatA/E family protein [Arcobacter ellisii]MBD3831192.1 twin-arginine translocase TatA/TatE family subunit [Arcobacter sp.]MDD3007720.1 twin-arginine translocase TatA/TatE family subunit [Arcobacter sp.]MDY3204358.1 twin-arginine translocase TatA/TatE family subunit [Arcobacter sp.]RXI31943.1 twin-arginine translocase TatA/TatE family subunit [Arcobacter ellisii]
MSMPGGMEWLLIALVVLLLFGGKKIPELAKGLGSGIKNFKKAVKDDDEEVADAKKVDEIEKKSEVNTTDKNETKQS